MKTVKFMLAGMALLFIGFAANAKIKQTKDDVLNTYIDAISHGNTSNLDKILDDDMQFNMQRGENVNTLSKDQFVASLKNAGTPDQSATATTTVEQEDDNSSVVKISFKYPDYTRTDEVTLSNAGGWTVTKVTSSFK